MKYIKLLADLKRERYVNPMTVLGTKIRERTNAGEREPVNIRCSQPIHSYSVKGVSSN